MPTRKKRPPSVVKRVRAGRLGGRPITQSSDRVPGLGTVDPDSWEAAEARWLELDRAESPGADAELSDEGLTVFARYDEDEVEEEEDPAVLLLFAGGGIAGRRVGGDRFEVDEPELLPELGNLVDIIPAWGRETRLGAMLLAGKEIEEFPSEDRLRWHFVAEPRWPDRPSRDVFLVLDGPSLEVETLSLRILAVLAGFPQYLRNKEPTWAARRRERASRIAVLWLLLTEGRSLLVYKGPFVKGPALTRAIQKRRPFPGLELCGPKALIASSMTISSRTVAEALRRFRKWRPALDAGLENPKIHHLLLSHRGIC